MCHFNCEWLQEAAASVSSRSSHSWSSSRSPWLGFKEINKTHTHTHTALHLSVTHCSMWIYFFTVLNQTKYSCLQNYFSFLLWKDKLPTFFARSFSKKQLSNSWLCVCVGALNLRVSINVVYSSLLWSHPPMFSLPLNYYLYLTFNYQINKINKKKKLINLSYSSY